MENSILSFATIFQVLDWIVVVLVLCAGMFAKKYLSDIEYVGRFKVSLAIKTLFISALFVSLYALAEYLGGKFGKGDLSSYVLSYAVATSLYELLLKGLLTWLKNRLGLKS